MNLYLKLLLTNYWHFRNTSSIKFFWKCWFIVINVMDFDNELRFWLHWPESSSVNSLGTQGVKGFLFSVNSSSGMNVTCFLVNNKKSTSPISWQNVLERPISLVLVRMKLKKGERERKRENLLLKKGSDLIKCTQTKWKKNVMLLATNKAFTDKAESFSIYFALTCC